MAKKSTVEAKPAAPQPETAFVDLMMVAADFVKSSGGIDSAKKNLEEAGRFIDRAGSAASAGKALEVLENLRAKIVE